MQVMSSPHERDQSMLCVYALKREETMGGGGESHLPAFTLTAEKVVNTLLIQITPFLYERTNRCVCVRENMKREVIERATYLLPLTTEKYNW